MIFFVVVIIYSVLEMLSVQVFIVPCLNNNILKTQKTDSRINLIDLLRVSIGGLFVSLYSC